MLLTQKKNGWQVELLDHGTSKYGLLSGDLLVSVDRNDASTFGPLVMAAFMDNASVRAFPIIVVRGGRRRELVLYTSDGKVPAPKTLGKKSSVASGAEAPEWDLPSLQGQMVSLKDHRGKWVLLNFWATWCLPCQEESPVLSKLALAYPQQLQVFAIAVQDEHKKLEDFAARMKPAYTVLESGDLKSEVAFSYGVNSGMGSATVPFSVLVRPDGTVAYVQGGYEAPSPLEKQISDFITEK
ncbi:TlpA disulfide reductase family protein [Granulicella sp. S156]|uniref:TlpA family protein disulfide reductase n=1 Tax=Granulicella sp. S156 TaxID=1747224 RepID=UPI00131E9CB8|nr:TlpA disulfide reductase family protein [Granulicella sp. S156]